MFAAKESGHGLEQFPSWARTFYDLVSMSCVYSIEVISQVCIPEIITSTKNCETTVLLYFKNVIKLYRLMMAV
jgi:hypothetical protein